MWNELKRSSSIVTENQFWTAVNIWKKNVHVVNRRVCSVIQLDEGTWSRGKDIPQQIKSLLSAHNVLIDSTGIISFSVLKECIGSNYEESQDSKYIEFYLRKLLPRNNNQFRQCFELVLLDKPSGKVFFINLSQHSTQSVLPLSPYCISFCSGNIILEVFGSGGNSDPSSIWLGSQLLPRIEKWAVSAESKCDSNKTEKIQESLALINKEKYSNLYQTLKSKYGQEMVRIWPECTDPAKFVYEDVAIAAYLLLLWEEQKLESCSFADLGCGNGLLVHILNSEGHRGVGLDVRERKIWSMYPPTTKLKVETVIPSDETLFPDADWIIGNHSDELTPWIPVMAARSSQKTRYFVLPCCAYEFDGRKFNRPNASQSQYNAYLQYVQGISERCGFQTSVDRLRIPSTKRICLIGGERTYAEGDWVNTNEQIDDIIRQGCRNGNNNITNGQWVANFKTREKEERVRNCTKLDRALQDSIVQQVVDKLLSTWKPIKSERLPDTEWNAGGVLPMEEVVTVIPTEQLKRLKSECGGLQTLLRNHHQIFLVGAGQVQLRIPQAKDIQRPAEKRPRVGSKPCWFQKHHPNGCFLLDTICSYRHE